MLWKSVILTILICGLLILGASTIVAGQKDTGDADKPAGTIAVISEDSPVDIEE